MRVDNSTRVPRQFVRNDEIVLNISFEATSQLQMGNEWIEFSARFSGKSHKIDVQVANVLAIYCSLFTARYLLLAIYVCENGQGMAFPVEPSATPDTTGASCQFQHDASRFEEPGWIIGRRIPRTLRRSTKRRPAMRRTMR